jgi:DNA-binding MarR family transcriptional regulator
MKNQKLLEHKQITDNLIASIKKETRAATLFVHTISEITGIHPTDIKCLDFLSEVRSATAGDLAKITGLTTGAITAVIDRLENAGLVKREADLSDRRKITVKLTEGIPGDVKLVRDFFTNQIPLLLSEYTTNEIKLITGWNTKIAALFQDKIKKMKTFHKANLK